MLLQKESSVSGFFCLSSGADGLTGVMPEGVGEGWEVGFAGVAGEEKSAPWPPPLGSGAHTCLCLAGICCVMAARGVRAGPGGGRGEQKSPRAVFCGLLCLTYYSGTLFPCSTRS